jgi:hypothetical protein
MALTPGLKAVKVMAMLMISKTGNFSLAGPKSVDKAW